MLIAIKLKLDDDDVDWSIIPPTIDQDLVRADEKDEKCLSDSDNTVYRNPRLPTPFSFSNKRSKTIYFKPFIRVPPSVIELVIDSVTVSMGSSPTGSCSKKQRIIALH
jgi:hypothetical protein